MPDVPRRHADQTLLTLERLRDTMNAAASEQERQEWWNAVLHLRSSIQRDARAGRVDKDAMQRVSEGVTAVYSALNHGYPADYSAALRAIGTLQGLLEARTTGLDGHRLR